MGYTSRRKKLYTIVFFSIVIIAVAITFFVVFIMSKNKIITFKNCDLDPMHYKQGDVIETLPDVEKYGYNFMGWYYDEMFTNEVKIGEDRVVKNIDLYPKFEKGIFTVTFDVSGGNGEIAPISKQFEEPFVFPTADGASISKGDLVLKYWTEKPNGLGAVFVPGTTGNITGEDRTYYAFWTVRETLITYYPNGGSYIAPKTYEFGKNIPSEGLTAPDVAPTGYVFDGWYEDELLTKKVDTSYELKTDTLSLYAKWNPKQFTAKFYKNIYDYNNNIVYTTEAIYYDGYVSEPVKPTHDSLYFKCWVVGTPKSETEMGVAASPFKFSTKVTQSYNLIGLWSTEIIIDNETSESAFDWSVNAENKIIISGLKPEGMALTSIVIPRQIELKDVVSIDGISSSNLVTVVLPNTVKAIGESAFVNCPNITSFGFSSDGGDFKAVEGVIYSSDESILYRYPSNKASTSYTSLVSTETIIKNAFNYTKNLVTLIIDAYVLEGGAINNCESIKNINITNKVTTLTSPVLQNCNNIENILLTDNSNFAVDNGILYETNRDGVNYKIIKCFNKTIDAEIVINNSVTEIGAMAFNNCNNIKTLEISSSVVTYGEYCFYNMQNLSMLKLNCNLQTGVTFGRGLIFGGYAKNDLIIYAHKDSALWQKVSNDGLAGKLSEIV